jgi:hypothetical protein
MALDEDQRDLFIDTLIDNITFSYTGVDCSEMKIISAYNDIPNVPPIASISFLPSGEKVGVSIGHFISERENTNYTNYGYWDVEICVVRTFAGRMNGVDGRNLSHHWIKQIESYIKVNWNSIINEVTVDRLSFTTPRLLVVQSDNEIVYGYEITFKIISPNLWHDEPEVGAVQPYPVEEIYVDEPIQTGVRKT